MFLTIIAFFIVLSVLVLVHEAGHYFVAKKLGVKVEEFGFGFPPKLFGVQVGETLYSINLLPIGGFVRLFGEDEAGGGKISLTSKEVKLKNNKRSFISRPVWQRASIVVAGVVMNFLLALVIITYLFAVTGVPKQGEDVLIASIVKNSPAEKVGLVAGETIISVDTNKITAPEQLIAYTKSHLGRQMILVIKDTKGNVLHIPITPRVTYPKNEGAMGVAIGNNIVIKKYPFYIAPFVGLQETLSDTWAIMQGLAGVLGDVFIGHTVPKGIAGPIGIAQLTGETVKIGMSAVLSLVALLSLNLAIMNILPIPALDGGRLFFILFEGVTGKKVHPKYEGYAHTIGMVFLLALVALVTFNDLFRVFISHQSLLP